MSARVNHACQRLWERYGLAIVAPQLRALEEEIAAGKSERCGSWGLSVGDTRKHQRQTLAELHEVNVGRRSVIAVWCPAERVILSFAPPGNDRKQVGVPMRTSLGELARWSGAAVLPGQWGDHEQ